MVNSLPASPAAQPAAQPADQTAQLDTSPSLRFRPSQRLLTGSAFAYVFKNARRSADDWFTILVRPSREPGKPAKLGLAIAKKELKFAKDRNRIKRLVRETFRLQQSELQGWDVVVMCRRSVQNIDNAHLVQRLNKHWRKIVCWPREEAPARTRRPANKSRRRGASKS